MPLTIQTIEELEKMEMLVTKGDWRPRRAPSGTHSSITRPKIVNEWTVIDRPAFIFASGHTPNADADLICAMRNNLPDLLSAAKWALERGYTGE